MSTNVVVYDEIDANFEIFMVILYEDDLRIHYINRIKVYLKVGRPACNGGELETKIRNSWYQFLKIFKWNAKLTVYQLATRLWKRQNLFFKIYFQK